MSRLHNSLDEVTSKFNKKIKTVRELILLKAAVEGEESPLLSNEDMFFGRLKEFEVALTSIEKTLSESRDHLDIEYALMKKATELKNSLEKQKKYLNHFKDNIPPQFIDSFLKIQKKKINSKSHSQRNTSAVVSRLHPSKPQPNTTDKRSSPYTRITQLKSATFSANRLSSPIPKHLGSTTRGNIKKSISSSQINSMSRNTEILSRALPKHLTTGSGIRPQTPQRKITVNTKGSKLKKPTRSYFDEPKE